ncbi:hypothetical protein DFH27DRAFT_544178 [Peziza echinospora]|nr:hypothetical protein DFH27DRAFT_544178 [Peziza echinospora]
MAFDLQNDPPTDNLNGHICTVEPNEDSPRPAQASGEIMAFDLQNDPPTDNLNGHICTVEPNGDSPRPAQASGEILALDSQNDLPADNLNEKTEVVIDVCTIGEASPITLFGAEAPKKRKISLSAYQNMKQLKKHKPEEVDSGRLATDQTDFPHEPREEPQIANLSNSRSHLRAVKILKAGNCIIEELTQLGLEKEEISPLYPSFPAEILLSNTGPTSFQLPSFPDIHDKAQTLGHSNTSQAQAPRLDLSQIPESTEQSPAILSHSEDIFQSSAACDGSSDDENPSFPAEILLSNTGLTSFQLPSFPDIHNKAQTLGHSNISQAQAPRLDLSQIPESREQSPAILSHSEDIFQSSAACDGSSDDENNDTEIPLQMPPNPILPKLQTGSAMASFLKSNESDVAAGWKWGATLTLPTPSLPQSTSPSQRATERSPVPADTKSLHDTHPSMQIVPKERRYGAHIYKKDVVVLNYDDTPINSREMDDSGQSHKIQRQSTTSENGNAHAVRQNLNMPMMDPGRVSAIAREESNHSNDFYPQRGRQSTPPVKRPQRVYEEDEDSDGPVGGKLPIALRCPTCCRFHMGNDCGPAPAPCVICGEDHWVKMCNAQAKQISLIYRPGISCKKCRLMHKKECPIEDACSICLRLHTGLCLKPSGTCRYCGSQHWENGCPRWQALDEEMGYSAGPAEPRGFRMGMDMASKVMNYYGQSGKYDKGSESTRYRARSNNSASNDQRRAHVDNLPEQVHRFLPPTYETAKAIKRSAFGAKPFAPKEMAYIDRDSSNNALNNAVDYRRGWITEEEGQAPKYKERSREKRDRSVERSEVDYPRIGDRHRERSFETEWAYSNSSTKEWAKERSRDKVYEGVYERSKHSYRTKSPDKRHEESQGRDEKRRSKSSKSRTSGAVVTDEVEAHRREHDKYIPTAPKKLREMAERHKGGR